MTNEEKTKDFIPALGYHWLTDFYDLTIKLTMPEKKFRTKLVELLHPNAGEDILEFGFGTGQNLLLAHQRNALAQFSGLDIDPKVKAIAEKKLEGVGACIQLDLYDGVKFPYSDNQFDKVFSSLVFHQLDRATKKSCLEEILRVLKPGGKLVVGDWGKASSKRMKWAFYVVQLLDGFATTDDNVNGLMPEIIKSAGFENVREEVHINTTIGTYSYYRAEKVSTE